MSDLDKYLPSHSSSADNLSLSSHSSTFSSFQQSNNSHSQHNRTNSGGSIASAFSVNTIPRDVSILHSKKIMMPASSDASSTDTKKRKGSPGQALPTVSPSTKSHKHQNSIGSKSEGSSNSPNHATDGKDRTPSGHKKSASQQTEKVRRIKTQRACDSCRRKKIRCDVIDDGSPVTGNINNGNGGLTCAHCKQYGFGEWVG
jgi:hypothetical protein